MKQHEEINEVHILSLDDLQRFIGIKINHEDLDIRLNFEDSENLIEIRIRK